MSTPFFTFREEPDADTRHELRSYDPLAQKLLFTRGIVTEKDAGHFLARAYDGGLHDPFLLNDMEKAVERILSAVGKNEHIVIYSDYDCDGIPGGVLLHDFFTAIKYLNFRNYIPHRHDEGYGLNRGAIDTLADSGATLMITVDCGITDVAEVAHARERGIDVILTDHHEPGLALPPAYAVLNPKRKDTTYPFPGLCGSGVAFKLISAIIARGNFDLPPGHEKWFLDVVGLATIADMVPLIDENRLLAHYGLLVMRKGRRLGLQHLFRTMRMQAATVTEDDIGFMIAPRINAASRMDTPEDAFRLLSATTDADAGMYARHLEGINNERKGVVGAMVKEIKRKLAKRSAMDDVLVIGDPTWRPALVGLAANTLAEEYNRPVFVWGRDGRSILKGSCRSSGVSVVHLMQRASDVFIDFGGHHASGGFSVQEEHIHTFGGALNDAYKELMEGVDASLPSSAYEVDAELELSEVTPALLGTLASLAPFGMGNPKPLFLFRAVAPVRVELFGKQKEHTKATFAEGSRTIQAIGFFNTPDTYTAPLAAGVPVDMLAHVEESFFMGRRETRLRLVEAFHPFGVTDTEKGIPR